MFNMQTYLVARFVPSLLVSANQPRGGKKSPLISERSGYRVNSKVGFFIPGELTQCTLQVKYDSVILVYLATNED